MKTDKKGRYQTGLRIPEALADELIEEAKEAGMSLNAYILMLIKVARLRLEFPHASSQTQQRTA